MSGVGTASERIVSIQDALAANAVDGHLLWGALIRRDLVLVPGPLDRLEEPDIRLEVLFASVQGSACEYIERIKVEQVRILNVRDHPEFSIAALTLLHPSNHYVAAPTAGGVKLGKAVQDTAYVWETLESQGAVPTGLRSQVADEALHPVAEQEKYQRRVMVQRHLVQDPGDVFHWVCAWLGLDCRPVQPDDMP